MRLKGEAYSERLEAFSTSTLQLLSEVQSISREAADKASDITTDSTLSEAEVVRQLTALKPNSTTTETK